MNIISIYFLLLTFWLEQSLDFKLTQITGLSLMNLCLYLMLIVWVVSMITRRKIIEPNPLYKYLALMTFVVVISIVLKEIRGHAGDMILRDEMIALKSWLNPLVLFVVVYNIIDDEVTNSRVILGLMVLLAVTVTTTQLVTYGIVDPVSDKVFEDGRAAGFVEPNQYASYLVLFIPLIITYILNHTVVKTRIAAAVLLVMVLIDLIGTGSRGGFISLLFALGVYFFILYRQKMVRLITLQLIIAATLAIVTVSFFVTNAQLEETVLDRLDMSESQTLDDYTFGRITLLVNGIELFLQSPLTGYGQDSFGKMMRKRFGISGNSHNDYLLYLVQYGIIGFGVFIILYLKIFQNVWNRLERSTDVWKKALYISYIAGFSGYALSMLSVNLFTPRYMFWIYTAVMFKYIQLDYQEGAVAGRSASKVV
ncbi:MAG: O-antigen ligase family protein [Desulfobacterales bacterium]|nr:O-antigen ligase family protein [Desulfobacterales bacterium]MDD4073463.1 O-antigen ligase family protein [Desulfobacterales bacterium]MDD4392764.1 O-antigen ligase family protein [Desulfobacterales bacterium]